MHSQFIFKTKKIFLLLFIFFTILSCTITPKKFPEFQWYTFGELFKHTQKLQPGDILISESYNGLKSKFGHASLIIEDSKIADFPSFGNGYTESPFFIGAEPDRKVTVLRFKEMTKEMQNIILSQIDDFVHTKYGITITKDDTRRLYCSQFVYIVFKNAGEIMGINADLDSNGGNVVLPVDILKSQLLENIVFE